MATKKQIEKEFKEYVLPIIIKQEGKSKDLPMRKEAWNNFTDMLCKDGVITTNQYNNWDYISICK